MSTRRSISSSLISSGHPLTMNSSVVPSCSATTPDSDSRSSRVAHRDAGGFPVRHPAAVPAVHQTDRGASAVVAALTAGLLLLAGVAVLLHDTTTLTAARPAAVVDAEPGELLSAEPGALPDGVAGEAWRIQYASQAPDGSVVPVSGMVFRPEGTPPEGGFPVISWAHVTVGAADSCAPSRAPSGAFAGLERLLALGSVVVATDYPGLGTPGSHPYLVGASEGTAVLDGVRAARALAGADAAADGPVGLIGYSQGGHAVLFARAMAAEYAPDVEVAGSVVVAPVTDVAEFVAGGERNPDLVVFRLLVLRTWADAYEELSWGDVTTPEAASVGEAIDQDCTDPIGEEAADGFLERLWSDRPEARPEWRAAFAANTPRASGAASPLLVVHGGADPVVPIDGTERFVAEACRRGEPVELVSDPSWDHGSVMVETWDENLAWLAGRLAGRPAGAGEDRTVAPSAGGPPCS